VLTLEANLDQAAQLMEYEALEELPVAQTARGDQFIGLVTRTNIAHAFNRVTLSPAALATGESNIFWASGYRVSRMQIPSGAVGKTLRDLDVRSRFEVSVLAVQANGADGGFVPVAADRPFQADDLIIAAGSSPDLRRFARELN
jgi:K+/H+ antiporter YhaU regulatory subunit KhtT